MAFPMTAPRDAIAHSQFDEPTRDLLLAVYDRLQREYGMNEKAGLTAVDVLLALAGAGEAVLFRTFREIGARGISRCTARH